MFNHSASMDHSTAKLGKLTLGVMDYLLFGTLLSVGIVIGVYVGFISKKQDSTKQYLLGGKTMSYFPVAMSLTASHVSGITLLAIPAEVYIYGSQYSSCIFTAFFTAMLTVYIYLPVFVKVQKTSTFEYLELRFSRPVRLCASIVYTLSLLLYIPMVVYVPALAFSYSTGWSISAIAPIICLVCIFYTTVGGLKAIVWTDTIQFTVTVGALFSVLYLGIRSIGGVTKILDIADEGGRLIMFDMDPNPFKRTSFWAMSIGMTATWVGHLGVNQGCVQRFLAVPTEADARKAMFLTAIGFTIVKLVTVFTGLIIYAMYHDCDPMTIGRIDEDDQILSLYVMEVGGKIPGLPGLFLAGLVSAALSTMSASINTAAGTLYEDFISPWISDSKSKERRAAFIMKGIALVVGIVGVMMIFVIQELGNIFEVSVSINGITAGAMLGLFTLGMVVPWANTKGAITGSVSSVIVMTFIIMGARWHIAKKTLRRETLPISIECPLYPNNYNITTPAPVAAGDEPMTLFYLSFMHYALLGTLIVVIVGTIVSLITGTDLEAVNPDHITPLMQRFLPRYKYADVPLKEVSPTLRTAEKVKEVGEGNSLMGESRLNV